MIEKKLMLPKEVVTQLFNDLDSISDERDVSYEDTYHWRTDISQRIAGHKAWKAAGSDNALPFPKAWVEG